VISAAILVTGWMRGGTLANELEKFSPWSVALALLERPLIVVVAAARLVKEWEQFARLWK